MPAFAWARRVGVLILACALAAFCVPFSGVQPQRAYTRGLATVGLFGEALSDYYRTYRLKEAATAGFLGIVRSHAPDPATEVLLTKCFGV